MASDRGYTAGAFALELGGAPAGFLVSASGGEPFGHVVEGEPDGFRVPKHIGGLGYADVVIDARAPMSAALENWVASFLNGSPGGMSGAIVMLDYAMKVRERLEWTNGVVAAVAFPAADASAKDPAHVRISIQPEQTQVVGGSGSSYGGTLGGKPQKAFLASNFRFSLSGLEQATSKVAGVSSITVTRRVQEEIGEYRDYVKQAVLDVSDVVVRVPLAEVAPFRAWFDEFVIQGKSDDGHERTATLSFLDPSRTADLLRLELGGLGIVRVAPERRETGIEVVPTARIELYCETVGLAAVATEPAGSGTTPTTSPADPVTVLTHALIAALRDGAQPRSIIDVHDIADRLRASANGEPSAGDFDRGRAIGTQWASEYARLDELATIAALRGRDDWQAVALPDGHSLLSLLAASRVAPAAEHGAVDLERDEFVAGIVASASDIYKQVEPILRSR